MFKLVVGQKTVASKNNNNFSLNPTSTTASLAPSAHSTLPNITVSVPQKPCFSHNNSMSFNSPSSVTSGPNVRNPKMYPTCYGMRSTKWLFNSKTNCGTLILSRINKHNWWSNFPHPIFNQEANPKDWTASFFTSSNFANCLRTRSGAHLLFNSLGC